MVVKSEGQAVKQASKTVDSRVTFTFKLRQQGRYRLVAKYQVGEMDPCAKGWRSREVLRVIKRAD